MEKYRKRVEVQHTGLPEEMVCRYVGRLAECGVHAYRIEKAGEVAAEGAFAPYMPEEQRSLYSLTKTISVMAIGYLLEEGSISLNDTLNRFFPEYEERCTNGLIYTCTVRDLLTMRCGMPCTHSDHDFYEAPDWLEELFTTVPVHKPGTYFEYDNRCAYALSAIVTRVSGKSACDLLTEKMFIPMGIGDIIWECDKNNVSQGGWGISTGLETVAKFGRLLADGGMWEGKRIISEDWIEMCLSVQVDTSALSDYNKRYGYGFQIWKGKPENVWLARGAFGQLCVICRDQDMVISLFSGLQDYNNVLDATWEFIEKAGEETADEESIAGVEWLAEENALNIRSVQIDAGEPDQIILKVGAKTFRIMAGHGEWIMNELPVDRFSPMTEVFWARAACQAKWEDKKYTLQIAFTESPYRDTLVFSADGEGLKLHYACFPQIRIRGKEYWIVFPKRR